MWHGHWSLLLKEAGGRCRGRQTLLYQAEPPVPCPAVFLGMLGLLPGVAVGCGVPALSQIALRVGQQLPAGLSDALVCGLAT